MDATVKPTYMGTTAKLDIDHVVVKAYQQASRSLPPQVTLTVSSTVSLRNIKPAGDH